MPSGGEAVERGRSDETDRGTVTPLPSRTSLAENTDQDAPGARPTDSAHQPTAGGEASADDLALLKAHVNGDRQAFAELVRRHRDRLWAVALRTVGDREEAADALQDALLAAYRSAAQFRGESAVTTWLHRIVVNACVDRVRRRAARPTVPLPDAGRPGEPAVDDGLTSRETSLAIRDALNQLPVEQRAAIVLLDIQGYPVAEVAAILGIPEGTVKSRCARGRARLAMILGYLRNPTPGANVRSSGRPAEPDSPVTGDTKSEEER